MILRLLLFVLLAWPTSLFAELKLASLFADHVVLQRDMNIPIWGTADAGANVTVTFADQSETTTADVDGQWRLDLGPMDASADGRVLTVTSGDNRLEVNDVLVGEVWLASGQSNMERQLGLRAGQKPIVAWEKEVAEANHPLIRQYYVPQEMGMAPQRSVDGSWAVCSPETVADFTAVGYFFARDLLPAINVPIGIIHSSWGGTPAESWTSAEALAPFPMFADGIVRTEMAAADPEHAAELFAERLARWYEETDPGSGAHPWFEPDLATDDWETMDLPVEWESAGHSDFDGVAWFRRRFDLPADWTGHDLELRMGGIDDIDTTWVNGERVGATSGWITPRVYPIPAGALRERDNVIAVRVLDTGGNGGIYDASAPFEIVRADGVGEALALAGPWRCRFSTALDWSSPPPRGARRNASTPTVLYNGMIAPLIPYAIRGVIWYQGESNADRPEQYRSLFPAMIADWRARWGQGDFPFLFVQIAPFRDQPPEIREAQLLSWLRTENTAMVVTIDCGDAEDIHPAHKQPVGARLALAARALAYDEEIEYSGPVCDSLRIDGPRVTLHFTHVGGGLVAKDGGLRGFTIAGADGAFVPAHAEIRGETVVVFSDQVAAPAAVRYGWANVADGNLFNAADLPASPFRTDGVR